VKTVHAIVLQKKIEGKIKERRGKKDLFQLNL
jgi:hypothetical protein